MRTGTEYAEQSGALMVDETVRTFSPHASSPSQARAAASAWAQGAHPDTLMALELVVSELVTNALRHGEGDVTMALAMTDEGIEVRVHDHGVGLPVARAVGLRALGGRGLHLVERVSARWGTVIEDVGSGKTVWAVIALSPARP